MELKIEYVDELDTGIEVKSTDLDITELYEKHKQKRNEKEYKKFNKDYTEEKRKKQQEELHRDVIEEIRY